MKALRAGVYLCFISTACVQMSCGGGTGIGNPETPLKLESQIIVPLKVKVNSYLSMTIKSLNLCVSKFSFFAGPQGNVTFNVPPAEHKLGPGGLQIADLSVPQGKYTDFGITIIPCAPFGYSATLEKTSEFVATSTTHLITFKGSIELKNTGGHVIYLNIAPLIKLLEPVSTEDEFDEVLGTWVGNFSGVAPIGTFP